MSTATSLIDRLRELGGEVHLEGERIKYAIPDTPEADRIIDAIRADRRPVVKALKQEEIKSPSLEEVRATLPRGVKLVSYAPKQAPFAVAPVSVVTNAGRFYRAYLADLQERLAKPEGYSCPPLGDILAKLGDAGLEIKVE